jgi:hypothetical protein
VIAVEIGGTHPRAYPIRYLTWHEIVNDEIAASRSPSPSARSAIPAWTFDRRVDGAC